MNRFGKNFLLLAALLGMTGAFLTGCTSSESGSLNNAAGVGTTQDGGQVTSSAQGSGDMTVAGLDASQAPAQDGSQDASSQDGQAGASSDGTSGAAQADRGDIATYDEANQSGADPADPQGTVYDADAEESADAKASPANVYDESSDAADGGVYGIEEFTGTFSKEDDSESVMLSLDNDTELSFSFAVCGIHGTAKVAGNQAVYQGDDNYTITFQAAKDKLTVTVGGDDAEASPINGTYLRDEQDTEAFSDADTPDQAYAG